MKKNFCSILKTCTFSSIMYKLHYKKEDHFYIKRRFFFFLLMSLSLFPSFYDIIFKSAFCFILIFVPMLKKIFFALLITVSSFVFASRANAQCSMCTISAEQGTKNGNTQGKGLNSGIIYLLAFPYVLIAGVGIIWYRNYRKKNTITI